MDIDCDGQHQGTQVCLEATISLTKKHGFLLSGIVVKNSDSTYHAYSRDHSRSKDKGNDFDSSLKSWVKASPDSQFVEHVSFNEIKGMEKSPVVQLVFLMYTGTHSPNQAVQYNAIRKHLESKFKQEAGIKLQQPKVTTKFEPKVLTEFEPKAMTKFEASLNRTEFEQQLTAEFEPSLNRTEFETKAATEFEPKDSTEFELSLNRKEFETKAMNEFGNIDQVELSAEGFPNFVNSLEKQWCWMNCIIQVMAQFLSGLAVAQMHSLPSEPHPALLSEMGTIIESIRQPQSCKITCEVFKNLLDSTGKFPTGCMHCATEFLDYILDLITMLPEYKKDTFLMDSHQITSCGCPSSESSSYELDHWKVSLALQCMDERGFHVSLDQSRSYTCKDLMNWSISHKTCGKCHQKFKEGIFIIKQ